MKITTVNLPKSYIRALQILKDLGIYTSKSEAIRVAVRDMLHRENSGTATVNPGEHGVLDEKMNVAIDDLEMISQSKKTITSILDQINAEMEA